MRSDHTTPVYNFSGIYKVIIDVDYWRIYDPKFPEDAIVWFTDGSRTDSGTVAVSMALHQIEAFASLWVNLPLFFRLKSMPLHNVHMKILE